MATPTNISPSQHSLKDWAKKNKALLDILLDSFVLVDGEGNIVEFNVAFTELCGESYRKVHKIQKFDDLVKIRTDSPIYRQIVEEQRAVRLDEVHGSSKSYSELTMIIGGIPVFSDKGKVVGALLTIRNVSAEDELQKKYLERKAESVTDGLTRLYNKSYAEGSLLRSVKNSLRAPHFFSVALIDIDFFKKVNDTYGHQAGDYVLATIAQIMKGAVRGEDVVGRFGGEEFICILSNSNVAGALRFGERLRKRVEQTKIVFEGKEIPVTVSVGTATFNMQFRPGTEPEKLVHDLVARADKALYLAKENGRNQVVQEENLAHPIKVAG